MRNYFIQHRTKRSNFALLAVICLCWHLIFPTMINLGLAPAVNGISEHCHVVRAHVMDAPQSDIHHHKIDFISKQQDRFDAAARLADQVMKNCPLCSHGLDGSALALFGTICLLLILVTAKKRPEYVAWAYQVHFYWRNDYYMPPPQAPPFPKNI